MSIPPGRTTADVSNIVPIPKEYTHQTDLETIVTRYKTLRLKGLEENPEAFSSKYEDEVKFPYEKWLARVNNPQARTFIALALDTDQVGRKYDVADHLALLLSQEWLGTVTIVGPRILPEDDKTLSKAPWDVFLPREVPVASRGLFRNSTLTYMLGGMFVLEAGRRKGHARRMIEQAVKEVRAEATGVGASRALVVSITERNNDAARRLYEGCSFDVWDGELVLQIPREQECVAMVLDVQL
ncbi:GNAT family N-acetyltransferase [Aspergillus alliaceus]|uniref:GNAT family N-acetyltransferase n=1 Tax=Petromyces alliaceus TaxID=209559 RepID=UPI0012A6FEBD|nr:uncharacterized protein BDW43DRAFT_262059 [Aspergillus alliaceus]KAB8238559.1 hypothetical protein BDW43DRAFT_262059 [Aspergillus alliaceus]